MITSYMLELENHATTHQRRQQIGELLAQAGDPRRGVGVIDGMPDILWLPVTPGGNVRVTRVWEPEAPDEEARVTHVQDFEVEPFYIAKYLVTYAQYQAFIEADDGFDQPIWWKGMPEVFNYRSWLNNVQNNGITRVTVSPGIKV